MEMERGVWVARGGCVCVERGAVWWRTVVCVVCGVWICGVWVCGVCGGSGAMGLERRILRCGGSAPKCLLELSFWSGGVTSQHTSSYFIQTYHDFFEKATS